jgi:hypothetical protein
LSPVEREPVRELVDVKPGRSGEFTPAKSLDEYRPEVLVLPYPKQAVLSERLDAE